MPGFSKRVKARDYCCDQNLMIRWTVISRKGRGLYHPGHSVADLCKLRLYVTANILGQAATVNVTAAGDEFLSTLFIGSDVLSHGYNVEARILTVAMHVTFSLADMTSINNSYSV